MMNPSSKFNRTPTYSPTKKLYVKSKFNSPDIAISELSESATQLQPLSTAFIRNKVNVPVLPHWTRGLHQTQPTLNTQSSLYDTQEHVIIPPRQQELFYERQPYHEHDTNNIEE